MAVISELIRGEADGSISFGDYTLSEKAKMTFQHQNGLYKVKTYKDITKLECNDVFVYESVPGTAVYGFAKIEDKVSFSVEGPEDAQITLELEPETNYEVNIAGEVVGDMMTNLGGKLSVSVELVDASENVLITITKK